MNDPFRDLPMGFGMALLQDGEAARAFDAMSPEQRREVLGRAHRVCSKPEMRALVSSLRDPGQLQGGNLQ